MKILAFLAQPLCFPIILNYISICYITDMQLNFSTLKINYSGLKFL